MFNFFADILDTVQTKPYFAYGVFLGQNLPNKNSEYFSNITFSETSLRANLNITKIINKYIKVFCQFQHSKFEEISIN